MKELVLKTKLNQGEIERLILCGDYIPTSERFLDQWKFIASGKIVGLIDERDGIRFVYRDRNWSSVMYPVTTLRVIVKPENNFVRLTFRRNRIAALLTPMVWGISLFAMLYMILVQNGWNAIPVLFIFALSGSGLFALPFFLVERQARKEVYYFISELINRAEAGIQS